MNAKSAGIKLTFLNENQSQKDLEDSCQETFSLGVQFWHILKTCHYVN